MFDFIKNIFRRRKAYSILFKRLPDTMFYARCSECDHSYAVGKVNPDFHFTIKVNWDGFYNYCPNCGRKMMVPEENLYEKYDLDGNYVGTFPLKEYEL